jgi:hypothetical protein
MCFWNDSDWTAQVYEEEEGPAPADTRCDECRGHIFKGQWRHHVFMQEHEECQACEDTWDKDAPPCDDGKHEYGEQFDYNSCERCYRLRHAVRQVEEEEGCTGSEAEPYFGGLFEQVGSGEGWQHYADRMAAMRLPELALVEPPDPWDVFDDLAGDYPWAAEYDDEPADEFVTVGGEG